MFIIFYNKYYRDLDWSCTPGLVLFAIFNIWEGLWGQENFCAHDNVCAVHSLRYINVVLFGLIK